MTDGLKDNHRNAIIDVLSANKRVERAVLFGSRAMETFTPASDIDIALYGDHLTLTDQANLATAIDELPMAQRVDLLLHATVNNEALCKHIEEHGIEWYRRGTAKRLDLPRRYRDQIEALLREHVPGVEVWAYGSRVTGKSHKGSDLDLVLRGPDLKQIPSGQLMDLIEALEESNVPIIVQAHDWARLPESFHREIEREYVVLVAGGEWHKVTLDDVIDLVLSSVDKKTKDNERAVQLCNYTDVYYNSFIHASLDFMTATATDREIAKCSLFSGDVIITKDSEKHDDIGVPALVREDIPGLICGYHLAILRPMPSKIEGSYLFYALCTGEVQHQFHSYANGITRFGLRKADIGLVEIPLPSLPEQRAIAHILGTLDDKIELNRRMNETLEEMARALFKSWFVDFDPVRAKMEGRDTGLPPDIADLFPDRLVESELGEIPERWEVKALGELIELAYGKALKADDRKSGSIPVYGSNGQVGWHDKKLAAGPGIVVGRKGNPGIVTWAHSDFFPIDTTFYVVPRNTDQELPFLFFALTAQDLPSIAADSAVPGLNRNLAYMNRQLVPDKQVIDEFNHYASEIFTRRHRLEEESRTLAALRDVLLPKLMSGELWVRDAKQFTRRTI